MLCSRRGTASTGSALGHSLISGHEQPVFLAVLAAALAFGTAWRSIAGANAIPARSARCAAADGRQLSDHIRAGQSAHTGTMMLAMFSGFGIPAAAVGLSSSLPGASGGLMR